MQNFISTETLILVSFLCKKMPNLFKYIIVYSGTSTEDTKQTNITKVSTKQVQLAKQHPSTIILQALTTAAVIQKTLDAANYETTDLLKQKEDIRDTLKAIAIREEELARKQEEEALTLYDDEEE